MSNDNLTQYAETINYQIPAIVDGEIIGIEEVDDQIFSQKMIGDGYAIVPTGHAVYSPNAGKIEKIAATNHAIYLSLPEGFKLLIHIGIDTIELKGIGFNCLVEEGNTVEKGDKLLDFDLEYVKDEGYNPTVSVILLNDSAYKMNFEVFPTQKATAMEDLALEIQINSV